MSKGDISAVERIIANTINETACGDPDPLASRIVAALAEAGYGIVPANGIEDTALGPQPFDELTREMRPQDSDAEMNALGEMLVRGVSMDEIARRLRRDHGDVRDKVVEVGRGCR